jgi:hypothetical protein
VILREQGRDGNETIINIRKRSVVDMSGMQGPSLVTRVCSLVARVCSDTKGLSVDLERRLDGDWAVVR